MAKIPLDEIRRRAGLNGIGFALECVTMIWWDPLNQREREGVISSMGDSHVLFRCEGRIRWVELKHLRAIIC